MRIAPGTSLLEFQIYLVLTALSALFLAQLLLLYHATYDRVVFLADRQLMACAAYRMVTRACDSAFNDKAAELGVQVKGNKLVAQIEGQQAVLLEGVNEFSCRPENDHRGVRGAWMACDGVRWYRANRKRVFSCLSSS